MRKRITVASTITLMILASLCLAQAGQGKTQTQPAKPRAAKPTGAIANKLVRYFRLAGNRITLIPVETNDGRSANSPPMRRLTWERVK